MRSQVSDSKSLVEAILLSSPGPVSLRELEDRRPPGIDGPACLARLAEEYEGRGIMLCEVADGWTARTRPERSGLCRSMLPKPPRISRAAMETLAAIAIFQPVTRP